ncbi:hypothetical protein C3L33_12905, partial [Rhododendron williamsianum]
SSTDFSENVADFSGWCPSPLFMSQPSNIRQRSFRHSGKGESSKNTHHSSQSSKIRIQLHEETSA